jgi:hypothetical protein
VTPLSWKFETNSAANRIIPLVSEEMVAWIDDAGVSKTVTIEILHDSVTALKDDEVWLEVEYLSTSGSPLRATASDGPADALAAGANQASSSETWTTSGMSNPNTQKLSVTFTPQLKGPIGCRVMVGKASKTLYIDPLNELSIT